MNRLTNAEKITKTGLCNFLEELRRSYTRELKEIADGERAADETCFMNVLTGGEYPCAHDGEGCKACLQKWLAREA